MLKVKLNESGFDTDLPPLPAFYLILQGLGKLVAETPDQEQIIFKIEEAIDELRATLVKPLPPAAVEKMKQRMNPDHWTNLRDKIKPAILDASKGKSFLTLKEILDALVNDEEFKRYQVNTLDARVRELANRDIEDPPFLLHAYPGQKTGQYRINPEAVPQ